VTLASRVVSEALANADAHAGPCRVEISYSVGDDGLALTVTDDGTGFDPARAPGVEDGHLGLTVMRERARGYGGECEITSAPGRGTNVRLWIPL
jgi:signal transduction histidine kinase